MVVLEDIAALFDDDEAYETGGDGESSNNDAPYYKAASGRAIDLMNSAGRELSSCFEK